MSLTRPVKLIPEGPMPAARSLSVTFASDAQGLPVAMSGSGAKPSAQSVSMTLASDHPPLPVSLPPTGQQTMAGSLSVAIASNQPALGILESGTGITTGSITATSQRIAAPLTRFNGACIYIAGTYAGINLSFEASYDNGTTYIATQAVAINGVAPISTTGALTNTSNAFEIYCPGATHVSVRSTSFTSGNMSVRIAPYAIAADPNPVITGALSANQSINNSLWAGSNALNGGAAGSVGVGGLAADSATVSGNPILTAGRVRAAVDSTFAANDAMALTGTTGMQLLVKPYGLPETDWQFSAALTTNVATAARAAGAAGIRNYTTALQYQNTSAVASEIQVLDGTTILWRGQAPASMALPASIQWPTPLRGAAATALNVQLITTGANTLVNLQGYQAP
ncbi:MAG: hypothetical protein K7J46_18180 [Bryobacter sp.]|nr:hypothetical protein [Bryobacter sp. CoA8 C33]